MKILLKLVKLIMALAVGLVLGVRVYLGVGMYKPVWDASKEIPEVDGYAQKVTDEIINRDVKIIGLGEATHGNREFQRLKLDVFKTLMRDNGVSTLCFEMSYGEGTLVNDYINGRSDETIEQLFSHIRFDIYHTEEIKDLIEFMKSYNENSTDGKLEFYGFDLQNPDIDLLVVNNYVKQHSVLSEFQINKNFDRFINGEIEFKSREFDSIMADLDILRTELASDLYKDYPNTDRVLKCIDNIFCARELADKAGDMVRYGEYRDEKMKDTVIEIYEKTGYPIMITGHNGHVGYAGSYVKTMGAYIKEEMGDDYYVIGTDYFVTKCNINTNGTRKNHTSYSADPLAYRAKRLGTYYLDFTAASQNETLAKLLSEKMPTGSLGEGWNFLNAVIAGSVRVYAPVNTMYDAMIFVYEATPLNLLGY